MNVNFYIGLNNIFVRLRLPKLFQKIILKKIRSIRNKDIENTKRLTEECRNNLEEFVKSTPDWVWETMG